MHRTRQYLSNHGTFPIPVYIITSILHTLSPVAFYNVWTNLFHNQLGWLKSLHPTINNNKWSVLWKMVFKELSYTYIHIQNGFNALS